MKRLVLAFLVVGVLLLSGCAPSARVSEPAIPAHFTTYTDKAGLFSISYPPEWELALSEEIEVLEQFSKEVITSIESDAPVERSGGIFFAGLPTETGYRPSVNIVVESFPPGIVWTQDNVVESSVQSIKKFIQDYHELSRVKTIVGERRVTIVDWEGTYPQIGKYHLLQMTTLVGKTAWFVTCTALPDEYSKWEDDFNAIVRSLRVLK